MSDRQTERNKEKKTDRERKPERVKGKQKRRPAERKDGKKGLTARVDPTSSPPSALSTPHSLSLSLPLSLSLSLSLSDYTTLTLTAPAAQRKRTFDSFYPHSLSIDLLQSSDPINNLSHLSTAARHSPIYSDGARPLLHTLGPLLSLSLSLSLAHCWVWSVLD